MKKYQKYENDKYANVLLYVIEKAEFKYDNLDKTINELIKEKQEKIKQLQNMSEEEFMHHISNFIFGVASKDYYITIHKRDIEMLKEIKNSINWLLETYNNNRELFNEVIKFNYKGKVKIIKNYISKLANSLNQKVILNYCNRG